VTKDFPVNKGGFGEVTTNGRNEGGGNRRGTFQIIASFFNNKVQVFEEKGRGGVFMWGRKRGGRKGQSLKMFHTWGGCWGKRRQ